MYWKFLVIRLIKSKTFSILVSVFIIKCLVSCTMEIFGSPFLLDVIPVMGLVGYCLAKIKKNKFVGL